MFFLFKLVQVVRFLFGIILLPLALVFYPSLRRRFKFEYEKSDQNSYKSFKDQAVVADWAFEVSSEGELEQIAYHLENAVNKGLKVELIYCSDSATKSVDRLISLYPQQLRVFRLPLVTWPLTVLGFRPSLRDWITSKKLVLVRYDFFPEIILLKWAKKIELFLASGTLISRSNLTGNGPFFKRLYWKGLMGLFNKIIVPSYKDKSRFQELGIPPERLIERELRVERIVARQEKRGQILSKFDEMKAYTTWLESFSGVKLILGSAWAQELDLFGNKNFRESLEKGHLHLCLAPHKLKGPDFDAIITKLKELFPHVPTFRLGGSAGDPIEEIILRLNRKEHVIIVNCLPGILCESYTWFDVAYIGGGFIKSVHSLLEPWLAGNLVICGPKVHRSTEYEFIFDKTPERLKKLSTFEEGEELYTWCKDRLSQAHGPFIPSRFINAPDEFLEVLT